MRPASRGAAAPAVPVSISNDSPEGETKSVAFPPSTSMTYIARFFDAANTVQLKTKNITIHLPIGTSLGRHINRNSQLFNSEYPDCAALGHFRKFSGARAIQDTLHGDGINAPSRLHCNVLLAINHKRHGLAGDAGIGGELPQELPCLRVECVEHSIIRAAGEDEPACCRQHWAPGHRRRVHVGRDFSPGIAVPGVDCTHVFRPRYEIGRLSPAEDSAAGSRGIVVAS